MTFTTCPSCGTHFSPDESTTTPSPSVVEWFRVDPGWVGEAATDEIYGNYLRATDSTPVSRQRFISDLGYLGVEQVLDDNTYILIRS